VRRMLPFMTIFEDALYVRSGRDAPFASATLRSESTPSSQSASLLALIPEGSLKSVGDGTAHSRRGSLPSLSHEVDVHAFFERA